MLHISPTPGYTRLHRIFRNTTRSYAARTPTQKLVTCEEDGVNPRRFHIIERLEQKSNTIAIRLASNFVRRFAHGLRPSSNTGFSCEYRGNRVEWCPERPTGVEGRVATSTAGFISRAENYSNMYFIYIFQCSDSSYYIGSTSEIEARVKEHNEGKLGACYTF